ncbi:MAG: bifunctional folylpolyglutamate synthase/dihydrofolate synthase [Proteobacteria bacterium]|nr:bifunctional folylpolyglutamate synthase/dihydrofolate synthase [Pseudomonadota bacterium]
MRASYREALRGLYALQARGVKLDLERMHEALALLDSPELATPFVHVAGTNGKGSVSVMLAETLQAAGYRTGLYTSPHLHRFVERIRVNGRAITQREVAGRHQALSRALAQPGAPRLTFFELTTLMAFQHFRDRRCDIAILEVGLGGRLDATNAAPSVLSVITHIGHDHGRILGTDLASIAREKAGILKCAVPAIVGVREPSALSVIAGRARELGVPTLCAGRDFEPRPWQASGSFDLALGEQRLQGLRCGLEGTHQVHNASCAVVAALQLERIGFPVAEAAIRQGLERTRWPGRNEWLPGKPACLLDAAHNLDGCRALASFVTAHRNGRKVALLFGTMADKDYAGMLHSLRPHVDSVVYAAPPLPRAAPPETLHQVVPGTCCPDPRAGLERAQGDAGERGLLVVAGSIFMVAVARELLLGVRSDPPLRM